MGLFSKSNSGRIRDSCDRNPQTGEVVCKRNRVHADGTETEIAGFTMTVDASCNVVPSNEFENEEGQLNELERKFANKMKGKCQNTPPEY